jgi:hypothetical protein
MQRERLDGKDSSAMRHLNIERKEAHVVSP